MKKKDNRVESRAAYAAARRARAEADARNDQARIARESSIAHALARTGARGRLEVAANVAPEVATVLQLVERKAPRLVDCEGVLAITRVVGFDHARDLASWKPKGKGRGALFRSLAEHLLARYATPAVLWNAFFDDNAAVLAPMAVHVAGGGSLFDYAKTRLPIPLTRRMCHELLSTSAEYGLTDAIRRVQARAAGMGTRAFEAWRVTRYAREIGDSDSEAFWSTVIEWLGKLSLFDARHVGPLLDYLAQRRRDDPAFSIKGRSALALLRAMKEWHGDPARSANVRLVVFPRSGFLESTFDDFTRVEPNGDKVREVWRVREITTSGSLYDEGRRMGHCVYSYAWRIERGDTSIWSITMQDGRGETGNWAMTTVEVHNAMKRVAQARGRFNRMVTSRELQVLKRWAAANGLEVSHGVV